MPPSSPSEQARTRRDNDGTHSTYSLRSAPRSTRRVANRRALTTPRQESEASGHGHPSTAIPPTLPKPKSTRATRTASSISLKNGNESAPKQKAGQLQMLEDHENNNATTDARDTETEDADTSLASREHGKITPQQVQDKIAVFSKFVGSGNGSRTKSDPSLSSEQMLQNLNNHCEPNKNGGSLQEKLYSGAMTCSSREDGIGLLAKIGLGISDGESRPCLLPTRPSFDAFMANINTMATSGEYPNMLGKPPFPAHQVALQPPHQANHSRASSMATSTSESNATSSRPTPTASQPLPVSILPMIQSNEVLKEIVDADISRAQLINPSSCAVSAQDDMDDTGLPIMPAGSTTSFGSHRMFTSADLSAPFSSSLMKKRKSSACDAKDLVDMTANTEILASSSKANTPQFLSTKPAKTQIENAKLIPRKRKTPIPAWETQAQHLGTKAGLKVDAESASFVPANKSRVGVVDETWDDKVSKLSMSSLQLNRKQNAAVAHALDNTDCQIENTSLDITHAAPSKSLAPATDPPCDGCFGINSTLEHCSLQYSDRAVRCTVCECRWPTKLGQPRRTESCLDQGRCSNNPSISWARDTEDWWRSDNYYTEAMNDESIEYLLLWGSLADVSEDCTLEPNTVLPEWYGDEGKGLSSDAEDLDLMGLLELEI